MNTDVQKDFDWQVKYLQPIKNIVGPMLLDPAPIEQDMRQATDLMVLMARDLRIGCRIRRAGYADKYPWDFTLRSRRDSGAETELSKIVNGWGDWLFYGHAEHDEVPSLARWFVIDLHAWRAHMIRDGFRNPAERLVRFKTMPNGDGTYFTAFDVRSFPPVPPICRKVSHDIPAMQKAA